MNHFVMSAAQIKISAVRAIAAAAVVFCFAAYLPAQIPAPSATMFRVGERINYTLSYDNYPSAGTAEIQVVSRGRLGDRDAVELTARLRTHDVFSAAIVLIDESATSIVAVDTGVPLFVKRTNFATGLPKERTESYLDAPAAGFDLLSLIYRLRYADSTAFSLNDAGRIYSVLAQQSGIERVITPAGEFDTTVYVVQSDFLTEKGIKEFRINIETGAARVPVLIRAKINTGELKATLSGVTLPTGPVEVIPVPVPTPIAIPTPIVRPSPTPAPYVNNQPLSPELAFSLGEQLRYSATRSGVPVATLVLNATERKNINLRDTLVLNAQFDETNAASGLGKGNRITAQVDPLTLLPFQIDALFKGQLASFSQSAVFDPSGSKVIFGPNAPLEVPVGTHSVLSLLYAVRSFKLQPSSDPTNPVNDTRVAVFVNSKAHVLYVRPSEVEIVEKDGKKVKALLATVTTEDPVLNRLGFKVWLSNDVRRVPLRMSIGEFLFDLETQSVIPPR